MLNFSLVAKTSLKMVAVLCFISLYAYTATAQSGLALYRQVKAFSLSGAKADVNSVTFKRDRVEMTFTGTFYFTAPIDGKVTGLVFIGQGTFKAQVPPDEFEKANVKRMLTVEDAIESDFKTAVFRFTDNTMDILGRNKSEGTVPTAAQALASELDARILKETGANLSSRVVLSVLNQEMPGFFFANFDGGKRGRFNYVLDIQNRIPTDYFGVNAGEKGLIFKYDSVTKENDVWLAFYSLSDYSRATASYSDRNDLVDISNYDMNIDLREPKKRLGLQAKIRMQSKIADLSALTFTIGESLGEGEDERLKKQMRIKVVRLDGAAIQSVQEDWESGFTVFLPNAVKQGQNIELEIEIEGDFVRQPDFAPDFNYPRSNASWYPRQGYLDRSTFNFTFSHQKKLKVASTEPGSANCQDPKVQIRSLQNIQ
ncbi:MAG: hypothetical protein ABIO36_04345 [Pyrinomonadaceae bacterium]